MAEFSAKITQKKYLTADMLEIKTERPDGFVYKSGQFVQLVVPDEEKPTLRSYSLASQPEDTDLHFCVKVLPDGKASGYLSTCSEGDALTMRGPLGHFVAEETAPAHFFVATGAGIAPIMGIIRDELERKQSPKEIHLLFGVRFEEDAFWLDKLDALTAEFPQFTYRFTLSKPHSTWKGLSGRVTTHLLEHPTEHVYYLCGSVDMVKDVRTLLISKGISVKQIRMEIF